MTGDDRFEGTISDVQIATAATPWTTSRLRRAAADDSATDTRFTLTGGAPDRRGG